jgi:gluconolactonase
MKRILFSLWTFLLSLGAQEVVTQPATLKGNIFTEGATWQQLSSGHAGCEGAQWIVENGVPTLYYAAHHDLLAYKWTAKGGLVTWRSDSPEATSFRPDGQGGYYVVEQKNRRLVRWNKKAQVSEVLADRFDGKMLSRPNDVRVKSDGTIWFTDPPFLFKKRTNEVKELDKDYVFRYNPKTKKLTAVIDELKFPNGIAFSPDEKYLFIGAAGTLYRWDVSQSGELSNKQTLATKIKGLDGLTFGPQGRLWACSLKSIILFDTEGQKLGEIKTPNKPTSIAFSTEAKLVSITMRDSCYIVKLK